jgi:hypothetical protein
MTSSQIVRTTLTFASALVTLGLASVASADEAPPTPPPSGASSAQTSKAEPKSEPEEADDFRLRIGFNFNGGAIVSPSTVGGGGFAFRIGVQPNSLLGIYYQVSPMVFAGLSAGGTSADAAAVGLFQNSLMASITPIDLIEIAAGPSLDYAGIATASVSTEGSGSSAGSKVFFGAATRFALHLGGKNEKTGRRTSFTLVFDPHFIFGAGDPVVVLTGGLGADWY